MKVKITQKCFVDNKSCKPGDVVETAGAQLLIGMGKAEKYVESEKPKAKAKKAPNNRMTEAGETR